MPYALSIMSASVTRGRGPAGDLELPGTAFGLASLRELGESRRLDHGGIAKL
jgi:hypothetical protein